MSNTLIDVDTAQPPAAFNVDLCESESEADEVVSVMTKAITKTGTERRKERLRLRMAKRMGCGRSVPARAAAAGDAVAQAQGIVSLIDSDDDAGPGIRTDGDDSPIVFVGTVASPLVHPHAGQRKRRGKRDKEGVNPDVVMVLDDDRKPAAKSPQWRRKRTRLDGQQQQQHGHEQAEVDDGSEVEVEIVAAVEAGDQHSEVEIMEVKAPADPLHSIFEIFPTVDPEYARNLYHESGNSVGRVITALAAAKSFPTAQTKHIQSNPVIKLRPQKAESQYDYMSTTSFESSDAYRKEVVQHMANEFPFMSKNSIKTRLKGCSWHYSIARKGIIDTLLGINMKDDPTKPKPTEEEKNILQYKTLRKVLLTTHLSPLQRGRFGKRETIVTIRRQKPFAITDEILAAEIQHVQKKQHEWMSEMAALVARNKLRHETEVSGTGVECSCCFGKIHIDEMVSCRDEGHLFCVECLGSFTKSQIFGSGNLGIDPRTKKPSLELLCFHGDGCHSSFSFEHLRKALDETTMEKYNSLQCQLAVDQAGLDDNLVSCPKCDYKAVLPTTQMVFCCPVEGCGFESCRKCGKESHIPLRCEEAKSQQKTDGRLAVEEAISNAKIRNCPKCKRSFIKSDGCNKMRCSCGAFSCYLCRQPIKGYDHFCQTAHCTHKSCGKCRLFTKDAEDDLQAMREAGLTKAKEFKDKDVDIDVDGMLAGT